MIILKKNICLATLYKQKTVLHNSMSNVYNENTIAHFLILHYHN